MSSVSLVSGCLQTESMDNINGFLLLVLTLRFNWSSIEPMEIAEIQPEVSYCMVIRHIGMPGVLKLDIAITLTMSRKKIVIKRY